MKIIGITMMTPASENIRGTSALPYHLLAKRDSSIEVTLYSFNFNELAECKIAEVAKELNVSICIVKKPWWIVWMFRLHLLMLRVLLPQPIHSYIRLPKRLVRTIRNNRPDGIWVYGEELCHVVKQFEGFKRVHTLPDCESLYYYRMLGKGFATSGVTSYYRMALMYAKFLRMERSFSSDTLVTHHLVGEADVEHLREVNPQVKAVFLRHPHYGVSPQLTIDNGQLTVKFHQPKIRVLVAGRYDVYMKQEADLLVVQLNVNANANDNFLMKHFAFTFLGKGWEQHVATLREAGYEVNHITFAPDYIEEICMHNIQITPIAIGTGTKGKVLDALANGLLVIGTPYAMENIAVKNGESCIEYRHPQEVIGVLKDIPKNIQKYEQIAAEGRKQVLTLHNRSVVSQQLFDIFR